MNRSARFSCADVDVIVRRCLVGVFAGLLVAWWSALVLAEWGVFSAGVCVAVFCLTALLAGALAGRAPVSRGGARWHGLLLLLLFAAALFLALPPSEMVLGGWDPGVYVHTAATVSRTGALRFRSPGLAGMDADAQRLLARDLHGVREPFTGMRVLPDGTVSPQFFHLYPCAMALFHRLGGLRAALLLNPLLGGASVLAVYVLARSLLGAPWGLAAALCLLLNPAQIWQTKFCTAEMLTQFLLLGAFCCLVRAARQGRRAAVRSWVLGGASLGAAFLARYDTLLVILPTVAVGALAYPARRGARGPVAALAAAGLLLAHACLHMRLVAPYYRPLSGAVAAVLGAFVVALPPTAWWLRRVAASGRWPLGVARCRADAALRVLCVLFSAWACYAWWLRPRLPAALTEVFWLQRLAGACGLDVLAAHFTAREAGNMRYLADTLGAPGLALALLGVAWLIARARARGRWLWVLPASGIMVFFVTNVFNDHFMLWVTRRFVPVVFPLLAVGAAAGLKLITRRAARLGGARAACGVGAAVLVLVLGVNARRTVTAAAFHDWPGLLAWHEDLVRHIPADAPVYCDQPGFAAPLRFLFGRRAFALQARGPEARPGLLALLERKAARGREAYLLSQQPVPKSAHAWLRPVARVPLDSHILNRQRQGFPLTLRHRGGRFTLYRVVPPPRGVIPGA